MTINLKPTPVKIFVSVVVAIIILLVAIKLQTCPEREFLLCGSPETLHEPVWGCEFYCTSQVKNYFLYVAELGLPFLILFAISYFIFSKFQNQKK